MCNTASDAVANDGEAALSVHRLFLNCDGGRGYLALKNIVGM